MKILIAGCGEVGESLAQQLSLEGHDLTLMDSDPKVLEVGMERYDVMAVQGNCASMSTLRRAEVHKAKLLIACTGSDELNLLCCMTAHGLNPRIHTIARVRNPDYLEQVYRMRDSFGISMTFHPEEQVATEMERLLKYPGFLKREAFLGGRVELAELRVEEKSPLDGIALHTLYGKLRCRVLICAILREGKATIPDGNFVLEAGDRVFVTAPSDELALFLKNLGVVTRRVRNVMITGGGPLAYYLCKRLRNSRSMEVTVIEKEPARCRELATLLPKAHIIEGDPGDRSLLESEGIATADALVAMTELDELNIITSLYAKSLGLSQVITKVSSTESAAFIEDLPLGSILSPGRLSCSTIVRYVRAMKNRGGAAVTIHPIADGQAEALEFPVDADTFHCSVPLKKLKLRPNIRIACIARGEEIIIPGGDSCFEEGDSVVVVAGGEDTVLELNDIFA